jgi:hypothetical protein
MNNYILLNVSVLFFFATNPVMALFKSLGQKRKRGLTRVGTVGSTLRTANLELLFKYLVDKMLWLRAYEMLK